MHDFAITTSEQCQFHTNVLVRSDFDVCQIVGVFQCGVINDPHKLSEELGVLILWINDLAGVDVLNRV